MTSARDLGLVVVRTSGAEELLLCPFHADRTPSASFNRERGLFYCYVCGIGLNLVQLAERLGVQVEEDFSQERQLPDFDLIDEPVDFGDSGSRLIYHSYFQERGIDRWTMHHFNLYFREMEPQAAVLPITNSEGRKIGVVYRYLEPGKTGTRYRIVGRTTPVWPLHHLNGYTEGTTVFVTEGAWSAMRLYQVAAKRYESCRCVALLGAKANRGITDALRPFSPVFLYDGDTAGRRACLKMRELMPLAHSWTLSKSPDDMSTEELNELLDKVESRR